MKTNRLVIAILCVVASILFTGKFQQAAAQQVVQLSGFVLLQDSTTNAAGVAVFVPHTSRGTHTASGGFFSMPVLPGDSVVIAALGYEKQYVLIPKTNAPNGYAVTIKLKQSAIQLPTVDVMPWPTERDLRMAIAKVKLPKDPAHEILPEKVLEQAKRTSYPMDASDNARHGIRQFNQQRQNRHMIESSIKLLSVPIR